MPKPGKSKLSTRLEVLAKQKSQLPSRETENASELIYKRLSAIPVILKAKAKILEARNLLF